MSDPTIYYVRVAYYNYLGEVGNSLWSYASYIELEPEDIVCVEVRSGFGLAQVVEVSTETDVRAKRWVVQKIDIEAHRAKLAE